MRCAKSRALVPRSTPQTRALVFPVRIGASRALPTTVAATCAVSAATRTRASSAPPLTAARESGGNLLCRHPHLLPASRPGLRALAPPRRLHPRLPLASQPGLRVLVSSRPLCLQVRYRHQGRCRRRRRRCRRRRRRHQQRRQHLHPHPPRCFLMWGHRLQPSYATVVLTWPSPCGPPE